MSMLELRHVSKSYGEGANEVDAISDIDLSVERGSLVAIMGPSGSGKSTLLTIAGSLEEPATGGVSIDGVRLSGMSRNDKARLRRRSVGYVFQDFNLLAGLTASRTVSLPLELDGTSMKKARTKGLAALEGLGLGDRAENVSRPTVRWRAPARRHREGRRGRPKSVARGRTFGRLGLGQRRSRHADDPGGVSRWGSAVVVTHDAKLASWADRVVSCVTAGPSTRPCHRRRPRNC